MIIFFIKSLLRIFALNLLYKNIKIGNKVLISKNSTLKTINNGSLSIGKNSFVGFGTFISSNGGAIKIGKNVYINRNCNIVSQKSIIIGDNSLIGPLVSIYDHNHDLIKRDNFNLSEVNIGNNVWIGSNCVILKGVTIGDNSTIGAGSVVSKDLPKNSILYNKLNQTIKSI